MPEDPSAFLDRAMKEWAASQGAAGAQAGTDGREVKDPAALSGLRVYSGVKPTQRPRVSGDWNPSPGEGSVGKQAAAQARGSRDTRTAWEEQDEALEDVQQQFYSWDDEELAKWGDHLVAVGMIDEDDRRDYTKLQGLWFDISEEAAYAYTKGRHFSTWDMAKFIAGGKWTGESEADRKRRLAEGTTGFTGTRNSTSRTVNLTDPMSAKALVNDTLSRALGREALPEELEAFRATLNSAEQANPSVTESSYTYEDGEVVSQSSTTSGGLTGPGAQQLLTDKARQSKEYGAYQAATTYANALFGAIASPV